MPYPLLSLHRCAGLRGGPTPPSISPTSATWQVGSHRPISAAASARVSAAARRSATCVPGVPAGGIRNVYIYDERQFQA